VSRREEIRVPGLAEPISHYTDAVRAGDLLFISGCVPVDADGRLVGWLTTGACCGPTSGKQD